MVVLTPKIDLFGESVEEIEADEARWQEQFAASLDILRIMAREASECYREGHTTPMAFGPDGRVIR